MKKIKILSIAGLAAANYSNIYADPVSKPTAGSTVNGSNSAKSSSILVVDLQAVMSAIPGIEEAVKKLTAFENELDEKFNAEVAKVQAMVEKNQNNNSEAAVKQRKEAISKIVKYREDISKQKEDMRKKLIEPFQVEADNIIVIIYKRKNADLIIHNRLAIRYKETIDITEEAVKIAKTKKVALQS